jgi:hypothetical protein
MILAVVTWFLDHGSPPREWRRGTGARSNRHHVGAITDTLLWNGVLPLGRRSAIDLPHRKSAARNLRFAFA